MSENRRKPRYNQILMNMSEKQKDCLTVEIAYFMIDNNSTIRKTAKRFCVSKSTIHSYIHNRLPNLDIILYKKVLKILDKNSKEKHIRGGLSTKRKSLEKK